jgi:hypothetical protein
MVAMARRSRWILIFLTFWLVFALFTKAGVTSGNDASRLATVEALVDYQSFAIDQSVFSHTGDRYFYDGRFYSDKPPVLSLFGALCYQALKGIMGVSIEAHSGYAYYGITVLTVGALSALALVYAHRLLVERFGVRSRWADFLVVLTGMGTLMLPYSTVFNNHAVSGALGLIALYYLSRSRSPLPSRFPTPAGQTASSPMGDAIRAGLLLSLAASVDIACFVFLPLAVVTFYGDCWEGEYWRQRVWRRGVGFAITALPITLLYFTLNLWISGSWLPPAMNAPLWDYPGSMFNTSNLSGLATHPEPGDLAFYTYHMILGTRGLLSHTPVLGVALLAGMVGLLARSQPCRREYAYVLAASLGFVAIHLLKTNNYSGWAYGIRWYATIAPLTGLLLADFERVLRRSPVVRVGFMVSVWLSIAIASFGIFSPYARPHVTHSPLSPEGENTFWVAMHNVITGQVDSREVALVLTVMLTAMGVTGAIAHTLWQRRPLPAMPRLLPSARTYPATDALATDALATDALATDALATDDPVTNDYPLTTIH